MENAAQGASAAPNDAAKVIELGLVLEAHDQHAAASVAFRRAAALDPSNPDTPYLLGVALAADGKYAEAIEPLRRALASAPRTAAIRLKLADTLLAGGDADAARREYRALVDADAKLAAAHYGLGRASTGHDAAASFARALELFPRYGAAQFALATEYRRAGRTVEAAQLLQNYQRDKMVTPPVEDAAMEKVYARNVSSTGLIRRGQILEREGDLAGALAVHQQVVKKSPKLDQAWVNLISLYARSGQPLQAEEAFRRAVELAPNRADAYYNFGVFCVNAERWADARKMFEKAVALDPGNPETLYNLGVVVERTGALARARALFQRALALKPHYRQVHFHLGRIYANERNYEQAAAEFQQAIEPIDAESPACLYALGAVQARLGRTQTARQSLERARAEAMRFGQSQLAASIERDLGVLGR